MPNPPSAPLAGRAEYAARFNRVVDHIQANLAEPMDLAALAEVACFSPYHFHRLFHGWMGETLHDFVLRLRLERAAAQLAYDPGKSITAIALDCGFSSSATFARAFKGARGVSASAFRQDRNNRKPDRKNCQAPARADRPSSGIAQDTPAMPLPVVVKELEPMRVAYIRHVGAFQGNPDLFERLFSRIRRWAGPRGLLLLSSARLMSIHHDNPEMGITEAGRLRLDAAVTIPDSVKVDGEMSCQRLEGGSYAVARVRIQPRQYMETWDRLMSEWLPGSGYQPDDRPCLEIHLNDHRAEPLGWHEVELCLAVKPL